MKNEIQEQPELNDDPLAELVMLVKKANPGEAELVRTAKKLMDQLGIGLTPETDYNFVCLELFPYSAPGGHLEYTCSIDTIESTPTEIDENKITIKKDKDQNITIKIPRKKLV